MRKICIHILTLQEDRSITLNESCCRAAALSHTTFSTRSVIFDSADARWTESHVCNLLLDVACSTPAVHDKVHNL